MPTTIHAMAFDRDSVGQIIYRAALDIYKSATHERLQVSRFLVRTVVTLRIDSAGRR
jgi:hypothetical protein